MNNILIINKKIKVHKDNIMNDKEYKIIKMN